MAARGLCAIGACGNQKWLQGGRWGFFLHHFLPADAALPLRWGQFHPPGPGVRNKSNLRNHLNVPRAPGQTCNMVKAARSHGASCNQLPPGLQRWIPSIPLLCSISPSGGCNLWGRGASPQLAARLISQHFSSLIPWVRVTYLDLFSHRGGCFFFFNSLEGNPLLQIEVEPTSEVSCCGFCLWGERESPQTEVG